MRLFFIFLSVICLLVTPITQASVLEVKHKIKTSIGLFDACEETFSYAFRNNRHYDIKTSLKTKGIFGKLYPFKASYHAVGIFDKFTFFPQDYFYETESRFTKRTKEIYYEKGVPLYRISTKNEKKRKDSIVVNKEFASSIDLLSVFGVLAQKIYQTGKCDLEQYSFNGKKYAYSKVVTVKKERLITPYFSGRALKCRYYMEVFDDADAGFLLNENEPIYFWVLKDDDTKAYYLAKILIESTPFGKLEALTTHIEVNK